MYDVYADNGGWLVYNFLWSGEGHHLCLTDTLHFFLNQKSFLCDSQFHCTCISDIYNVTELILNRENIFEFLYCIRFLSHCDLPLSLMSRSNKFIFYFKFVSLDLWCVFLRYYSASFTHSIPSFRTVFFFLDLISYSFHMLKYIKYPTTFIMFYILNVF